MELLPDNLVIVAVYERCADQWRGEAGGLPIIDNGAIESALRIMTVPVSERLAVFDGVKVLIGSIREALAEERKREAANKEQTRAATQGRSRR